MLLKVQEKAETSVHGMTKVYKTGDKISANKMRDSNKTTRAQN